MNALAAQRSLQLDYAPLARPWVRVKRYGRRTLGVIITAAAVVFLWKNPPGISSSTFDQLSGFRSIRATHYRLGQFDVFYTSRQVPFCDVDVVDPLPTPGTFQKLSFNIRDYSKVGFGFYSPTLKQVVCVTQLHPFDAPVHAISFVRTRAMQLDRGTRTRLAESIMLANEKYHGRFNCFGPPTDFTNEADINAETCLNAVLNQ